MSLAETVRANNLLSDSLAMQQAVSVIIPTHNRARLVSRALDSVFNQSLQPLEVILVDDGSTDDTARLLATKYPQVSYLYQHNSGVSTARNLGIKNARGHWIALLDSDDEWLPDKLENQLRALAENPQCKICHGEEIWIRNGKRVNPKQKHKKQGGWLFEHCLPLCVISPSAVILDRQLLLDIGLFDENLPACEDYDLWLRLCAFHEVLYLENPLITKYGGHEDQLSSRFPAMDRFRMRALEKIISSPNYTDLQRNAALKTWQTKKAVYSVGVRKRGRIDEVQRLQQTEKYLLELLETARQTGK